MSRVTRPKKLPWRIAAASAALMAAGWLAYHKGPTEADDPARWRAIEQSLERKDWAEARVALAEWVGRHPDDNNALIRLGGVLGTLGQDAAAASAYGRVKGKALARAEAQAQLGELAIRRRDLVAAEKALRSACGLNPRGVEPRKRLVYLLTLQKRDDEAREVLWELYRINKDPRELVTLAGLAKAEADSGDPGADVAPFLAASPDDPWLRRARGLAALRGGRAAAALPDLEAAARSIEDDPAGRLALAECWLDNGKPENVEATLGPEPTRPAERGRWWLLKGRAAEAKGSAELAIDLFRRAAEAAPDTREPHYQLGRALARRGDEAGSKAHLARAEANRTNEVRLIQALDRNLRGGASADSFAELGEICRDVGLRDEARAWFQQAIRLDPIMTSAQAALASIAPSDPAPSPPRIRESIAAEKAAAPAVAAAGRWPVFEDIAAQAGIRFKYECGEKGDMFIGDTMGGGVAIFDFDADGRPDIYFVNGCKLPFDRANPPRPNKLYRNLGDNKYEDVTERAGLAGKGYGMGCAVGDYDGDGDEDLFLTGLYRTILYRNDGGGRFTDVTEAAGVASTRWTTAAGFADLDADGDLDLVAATYVDADMDRVDACQDPTGKLMHCPPGHFPGQLDHLFRNNGDGTFADVAASAGLDVPNGLGLGLAIADLDGDGRLDVFVANDAVPNFFFHNLGGLKFEERGASSGLAYDGSGRATASMGVVAEDLDGDGHVDVFHTNFLNEPNTLHRNLGGGQFDDATVPSGLDGPSRPVTGFGTAAFDADNDGRLDLFVSNGHVDDRPWIGHPMAQPPHFFAGRPKGRFDHAPATAFAYLARPVVGRGVAAGDLDGDGRVDLVVVHRDAPASVLRNVTPGVGHWLGLDLRDARGRAAVGARVEAQAGPVTAVRFATAGTSYLGSHDPRIHLGLGASATVDRLDVAWPSGAKGTWTNLAADRAYELREGGSPAVAAGPR